jgi:tetratricopeptide (TPR) repeat protein
MIGVWMMASAIAGTSEPAQLRPDGFLIPMFPLGGEPWGAPRLERLDQRRLAAVRRYRDLDGEALERQRDREERVESRMAAAGERRLDRRPMTPEQAAALHVQVGWLLHDVGRQNEAIAQWIEALDEDPHGPLARHAQLGLADHALDAGEIDEATARFTALREDPVLGDYAVYQLAWCAWEGGDPLAAAELALQAAELLDGLAPSAREDAVKFAAFADDATVDATIERACAAEADPLACVDRSLATVDRLRQSTITVPPAQGG